MKFTCRFRLFFLLYLINPGISAAQQLYQPNAVQPTDNSIQCGTDLLLKKKRLSADYVAKEENFNRAIRSFARPAQVYTLPVVVHIIGNNPFGITNQVVLDGIQDLNDAFGKTGPYSASLGVDTELRFCLAKKDPNGGITNGITRTTSFYASDFNMELEDGDLKNLTVWDPSQYINIWIISNIRNEIYWDFVCGNWYRLNMGGYATMMPGNATDGIVVTSFGVTLAHEMGHYLGLYHTWQGGCTNYDCTFDGDRVCDTPPDRSVRPSTSCSSPENSCYTDTLSNYSNGNILVEGPDQIRNFMDYGNAGCSNMFTLGQKNRMHAALLTQRPGLLGGKCTPPCNDVIVASFTRDIAYPVPGNTVNFTNTSTGATTFEWYVNNSLVATTPNYSYTVLTTGNIDITLKAYSTASCFGSVMDRLVSTCGVTARFYTDRTTIASLLNVYEDSLTFENVSVNGQSFQWLLSNDQGMAEHIASTDSLFTYVFPAPGNYYIRLVAVNGSCKDTSSIFTVPVLDPTADGTPWNLRTVCYNQNRIRVSFCITNYGMAPLPAGTPVNFYDRNPFLPGAVMLSPTYYLPNAVPGGNCYICFTHILNVNYRNVPQVYLVFNDAGTSNPVVLPNAVLTEKLYTNNMTSSLVNRSFVNIIICEGESYGGYNLSGNYIDTLYSQANGCDSIRTLNLTVKPSPRTTVNISICQGENYLGYTASGRYVDVFTATNGCDSTRTLNLIVKPVVRNTVSISICEGDNYQGYIFSGTYIDTFAGSNGCDSIRVLYLNVKLHKRTNIPITICQGETYAGYGSSGTYTDIFPASNGCDSIRTLILTVKSNVATSSAISICEGENYNGYTVTGNYTNTYAAANGCDSTHTLVLTVKPVVRTTVNYSICEGQSYLGYSTAGTFTDIFTGSNLCDSIRTLHLTVKPVSRTTISAIICEGENYYGHTSSGTFTDVLRAVNGCDSIRTLYLTVNPKKFTTVDTAFCYGERYFAQGNWQTRSGIYRDTFRTVLDCDSIIVTNITVHPLPQPDLGPDRFLCQGDSLILTPGNFEEYQWLDGSSASTFTATQTGIFSVTVSDINDCRDADSMSVMGIAAIPANFLPPDTSLCRGNVLQLRVPGYSEYNWNTGHQSGYLDITRSDNYVLNVVSMFGCPGTDSINVFFKDCPPVYIPNAFTPGNDGLNDVFKPVFPAPVKNYHLQIFNRFGERLFETFDYLAGWNGNYRGVPQSIGAYVYQITFTNVDGGFERRKGTVVLIR